MVEFTREDVGNLIVFIEAGARALSGQNPLDKAAAILGTADALSKKVVTLVPAEKEAEKE